MVIFLLRPTSKGFESAQCLRHYIGLVAYHPKLITFLQTGWS
jgi:hypothetical protein